MYDMLESNTDELLLPQIVTPLPLSVNEKAGTDLHLLCLLTGYPPIEIEWYWNEEHISDSNDPRITTGNNKRELIIKKLSNEDCGSITFRARNRYGEVSSTCFLRVTTTTNNKNRKGSNNNSCKLLSSPTMKSRLNRVFGKSGK